MARVASHYSCDVHGKLNAQKQWGEDGKQGEDIMECQYTPCSIM